MPIKIDQKKQIVQQLVDVANQSVIAIAADYRGMAVSHIDALRAKARENGIFVRVYRNTLAKRAIADTAFACLAETLVGPIILLFAQDDPGAAAKMVQDFIKKNERLQVRALALEGILHGADQLKAIASLPSRDEALAQLLSVMKAPITQFVRTVKEPTAQLVRVMAAIRDQKQSS